MNKDLDNINERSDRLEKLRKLKSKGINPYPAKSNRSHQIKDLVQDFDEFFESKKDLILAGRLMSIRSHGKLSFAKLEDASGTIQLVFSKKEWGDEAYKDFSKLLLPQSHHTPHITHHTSHHTLSTFNF